MRCKIVFFAIFLVLNNYHLLQAADIQHYMLDHDIQIGGDGRWDYVICNSEGSRLYAPRSNHTQIIDLATGKVVGDIPKTDSSHGVALDAITGRGFISNGSSVTIFDLKTFQTLGKITAAADADCIINDPVSHHVMVFCGDAGVVVPIADNVDPISGKSDPPIDLAGEPEFAVADGKGHVYANIKNKAEVVDINTATMRVEHRYPLAPGANPTGMSMDLVHRRLFIGCRNQILVIMNADTGAVTAHFAIGTGVDATGFYHGSIFASCGDGPVTIVHEDSPDSYSLTQTLKTERGARTLAVNPLTGALYLPTADFSPSPATDANPHPRPVVVPGTFRIVVATAAVLAK